MCPGNNNKDEHNSPKTLYDKDYQALSQKFRQLIKAFPLKISVKWNENSEFWILSMN